MMNADTSKTSLDGEVLILWALPVVALFWFVAVLVFPGFVHPMSPTMTADEVAAFYRDPDNLPRIRYSMIVLNWFGVALIPFLMMIAMQMRRMAHNSPVLSYCFMGCAAGGPALFCVADIYWLLAAYRPERSPELIQMFNDLAWVTFTSQVGFLFAQNIFLAIGIYLDRQDKPVFAPWVAHFNVLAAFALAPAAFATLAMDGPLAWDGLLSFWVKNISIAVWIVVMTIVVGKTVYAQRRLAEAAL